MSAPVAAPAPASKGRTIEQLLDHVSASRLTAFHQCRLKFYFTYVLGLPRPGSAALLIGKTDHAVLQYWNKARWRGQPLSLELLRQVFNSAWIDPQKEQPIRWFL